MISPRRPPGESGRGLWPGPAL